VPAVAGMARPRVDDRLSAVWQHGLGLVIAPAGSGKTTLMARFAAASPDPVAWYRAEGRDQSEAALLQHLEAALLAILPGLGRGWTSVEAASRALEQLAAGRILLVVDDAHTLEGSTAEGALERFIDYAPPSLAVIIGSRSEPAFNLSRRRVSGSLLEIGPEDLRFRSWEVERLFRDFYAESVGPEEIARLARRTDGWAAGLQLFHLATAGKSADERRRILASLGSGSRVVREYLTRNVLDELPADLRSFLIQTSVLGILSGPLTDGLLGRSDGARVLEELERRRLFTFALDDGTYRYHEVLRGHLEGVLLEERGEVALRAAHRRAGELLEAVDALAEALVAYCRAEAWDAAERLVAREGRQLAAGSAAWLDVLPAATVRHDSWLILATARRHRAEGRWVEAIEAYQLAEAGFGASSAAQTPRRERVAIASWLEVSPGPPTDWSGRLRTALLRDPLAAARGPWPGPSSDVDPDMSAARSPGSRLGRGLALLAGGRVAAAVEALAEPLAAADGSGEAEPATAAALALARGAGRLVAGDPAGSHDLEAGIALADGAGAGWLARLGRSLLVTASPDLPPGSMPDAADDHDPWSTGLTGLLMGWLRPAAPATLSCLDGAADRFATLGAAALEAWALALAAFAAARQDRVEASAAVSRAVAAIRRGSVPDAHFLVELALARIDRERADLHLERAAEIGRRSGLVEPRQIAPDPADERASAETERRPPASTVAARTPARRPAGEALRPAAVSIELFGGFRLLVDGREVDLASVKPRARQVLHLLGLACGGPVHREVILTALWPDTDPETAARLLHVAVSSLRTALEPGSPRGGAGLIRRDGDAYRLGPAGAAEFDLIAFQEALDEAASALAQADSGAAMDALRRAIERYRGDLLPEEGPAEWVVDARDRARLAAVGAARSLADQRLAAGDQAGAAQACARGLTLDRFDDGLWRLLIDAHDRAGDRGAAHRARRGYAQMLAELGLGPVSEAPARHVAPDGAATPAALAAGA
jgi:DNA-binding SARP family transcriptional activator